MCKIFHNKIYEHIACFFNLLLFSFDIDSNCFVSSFEKFITFAITKSCFSNHVVVYPLRDSTYIDASFFYMLLNHRISNSHSFAPEEQSKTEPAVSLDSDNKQKNDLHKYECCTNSKKGKIVIE